MIPAPLPSTSAPAVSFRWTGCGETIQTIELQNHGLRLVVVGNTEHSVYEWILSRDGRVVLHSDDAWLRASDALQADPQVVALAAEVIERARRAA